MISFGQPREQRRWLLTPSSTTKSPLSSQAMEIIGKKNTHSDDGVKIVDVHVRHLADNQQHTTSSEHALLAPQLVYLSAEVKQPNECRLRERVHDDHVVFVAGVKSTYLVHGDQADDKTVD